MKSDTNKTIFFLDKTRKNTVLKSFVEDLQ